MKIEKIQAPAFLQERADKVAGRVKARSVSYLNAACELAYGLVVTEEREAAQKICDVFEELSYEDKASLWRPMLRVRALNAVLNDAQERFAIEVERVTSRNAKEKALHDERMAEENLVPISFLEGDLRAEVAARLERVMRLLTVHALGGGALGVQNTLVLCEEQSIRLREIAKLPWPLP